MMATDVELMECIEGCRTCGVFFLTTSNFLRRIFAATTDDPEMVLIRMELASWNVEINENDGYPQFICTSCIHEFQNMFKFRRSCVEIQEQWRHFCQLQQENKLQIKTEQLDPSEEQEAAESNCDFIYVDDLSDGEYDGGVNSTPFNIPNVSIKNEIDEAIVKTEAFINTTINDTKPEAMQDRTAMPDRTVIPDRTAMPEQDNLVPAQRDEGRFEDEQLQSSWTSVPASETTDASMSTELQCSMCLHVSATAEQHRQHIKRIHDVKNLECHICGKKFKNSTPTRLEFHLKWHKLSRHVKCAQCGFFCDSRQTLREHTRAIHSKIECNICGKRIFSKKMKAHMREHELQTSWPCSYCTSVFDTEAKCEEHILQVHTRDDSTTDVKEESTSTGRNELVCTQCPQICANTQQLEHHVMECHPVNEVYHDEVYHCSQESELSLQTFSDELSAEGTQQQAESYGQQNSTTDVTQQPASDGDDHVTECSSESEGGTETIQQFACAQCAQTFSTVEDLCAHHDTHKPDISCHICGKKFELKFSLNRHLSKHKAPF